MQTDFDRRTTTVMDEILKIAQAVVITAVFVVAGEAVGSYLAMAAGAVLYIATCLYVGVRVDSLVAFARYKDGPRRFTRWDSVLGLVSSATFALWLAFVLRAVLEHEGFV